MMTHLKNNHRQNVRHKINGFTLVELLITISVLAVLAALVIPTVRMISKGRQTRETARIIGTTFVAAQSQAIAEGYSGVMIQRNYNVKLGNAANRIYRVRAPRPFTGYGANAVAIVDPVLQTASIPVIYRDPLTNPDTLLNINDHIQFNHRGAFYRITAIDPDPDPTRSLIAFAVDQIDPPFPPTGGGPTINMEFKVFRRPVLVPTTATELPGGFMIDLEYSGHGATGSQFFVDPPIDPVDFQNNPQNYEVVIVFNNTGGIDTVYRDGLNGPPSFPQGPVNLMVAEFDVERPSLNALNNKQNLWVTINRVNGMVSIGNMAESGFDPITPLNKAQALSNARSISRSGISANQ